MLAQLLAGLERDLLPGLVLCPVDLAVFQCLEVDLADRRLLVLQGVLGVLAPVVGGGDDEAMGERLLARGGEETVDISLLDAIVLCLELALDGVVLACALGAGDQVDTGVACVQAAFFGPISISPDVFVQVAVGRFVA